jgi:hypothetical protein
VNKDASSDNFIREKSFTDAAASHMIEMDLLKMTQARDKSLVSF